MKAIEEYQYSVVVSLVPLKPISILRVEINIKELTKDNYSSLFDTLLFKLRDLGFSISTDKSFANYTEYGNVLEFSLEPYTDELELAKDVVEELRGIFGTHSVLNRVRIKGEVKSMKT